MHLLCTIISCRVLSLLFSLCMCVLVGSDRGREGGRQETRKETAAVQGMFTAECQQPLLVCDVSHAAINSPKG